MKTRENHKVLVWVAVLLITISIWAFTSRQTGETLQIDQQQSSITYVLEHPFHTVTGTSQQITSKLTLADKTGTLQQVQVSVPVKSFDSRNRARDRDMLKATEADTYPNVTFTSSHIQDSNGHLSVKGKLTFHGVTKDISLTAQKQKKGEEMVIDGQFEISLEEYGIHRPAIFRLKVKDNLIIRFHLVYSLHKDA